MTQDRQAIIRQTPRKAAVDRLTKQFISRGVSEHTAKAWAEAETPEYRLVFASAGGGGGAHVCCCRSEEEG